MSGRFPDFLIVGAAKAGTTSVARWLGMHPDVFVPYSKELHLFDRPGWDDPARREWYRQQFSGRTEAIVGEATPSYLAVPAAAARMAAMVPDARLVAVLRNPVDRAVSHYWYVHALNREPRGIEEALFAPEGAPGPSYLEDGRYLGHLERLLEHFPRDALCVRLFDDMTRDPGGLYRDLCEFLGVDSTVRPDAVGDAFNTHHRIRAPWVRTVMLGLRAYERWPALAQRVDRAITVPSTYPKVDEELRQRLTDFYAEDNARLSRWLERELPGWGPQ